MHRLRRFRAHVRGSLVSTLVVRDDRDVVGPHLEHHLRLGVDHVFVTLHRPSEETFDVVRGFERNGWVTTTIEEGEAFEQSRWVTRMARRAHDTYRAGWLLHADADEFWCTSDGEPLSRWFRRRLRWGALSVPRHDVICVQGEGPFWTRCRHRKIASTNAFGKLLPGKVAHPMHPRAVIDHGNHRVSGVGPTWRRAEGLTVLHVPARSATQYVRKVTIGAEALAAHASIDPSIGTTWRRQAVEIADTGTAAHLETLIVDADRLAELVRQGVVVPDDRIAHSLP